MGQQLKILSIPLEGLGSVLSTHKVAYNLLSLTPVLGDVTFSSDFWEDQEFN